MFTITCTCYFNYKNNYPKYEIIKNEKYFFLLTASQNIAVSPVNAFNFKNAISYTNKISFLQNF